MFILGIRHFKIYFFLLLLGDSISFWSNNQIVPRINLFICQNMNTIRRLVNKLQATVSIKFCVFKNHEKTKPRLDNCYETEVPLLHQNHHFMLNFDMVVGPPKILNVNASLQLFLANPLQSIYSLCLSICFIFDP